MLNIPSTIAQQLNSVNNILLVGLGGNDILAGLPIYYNLVKEGKKVHFANISNTDFKSLGELASNTIVLDNNVVGVTGTVKVQAPGFTEGYLSQFFKASLSQDVIVWLLNKMSVQETKISLTRLVEHLKVDHILLIDSGVDSMMQGNEGREILTNKFITTTVTLAAIQQIEELQNKVTSVCINNTTVNSNIINDNLSNLALQGGFLGGCYLLNFMISYKFLKGAYKYEINNGQSIPEIEHLVKITDVDFDEDEIKPGLVQYLFFNPIALAYNNVAIHKILEAKNYFESVQLIAPFINQVVI
jgi:hypothetical protein